jgi:hypothetical protein
MRRIKRSSGMKLGFGGLKATAGKENTRNCSIRPA